MSTPNDAPSMPATAERGLSHAEVEARVESGRTNKVKDSTSRSLAEIIRAQRLHPVQRHHLGGHGAGAELPGPGAMRCSDSSSSSTPASASSPSCVPSAPWTSFRSWWRRTSWCAARGRTSRCRTTRSCSTTSCGSVPASRCRRDAQIIESWGLELDESMLTGESRTVRKTRGGPDLLGVHRGVRHGPCPRERRGRTQLRGHADRPGQGLQENRLRLEQGHQHHPEIHDLPGRAPVCAARLVADQHRRRMGAWPSPPANGARPSSRPWRAWWA